MAYQTFFNFGKSLNNNIKFVNDAANPLTSAVIPSYNTQFNHGPTAFSSKTWDAESATFMKEYANGWHGANGKLWDKYCKSYWMSNQMIRLNLSAINQNAFDAINSMSTPQNTVADNLLRNALELHCIYYPSATFTPVQYDPNIANSPFIHLPNILCGNCNAIVYLPQNTNDDRIIKHAIHHHSACIDVLAYIYMACKNANLFDSTSSDRGSLPPVHLMPHVMLAPSVDTDSLRKSNLFKHLNDRKPYYERMFNIIMQKLGSPSECRSCESQYCFYNISDFHPWHPKPDQPPNYASQPPHKI